jgi:hypothetical protein
MLTEIAPDGTRSLSRLLEDASKNWIPGMNVSVITGRLEEEAAKMLARFLVQGVKVELYYVWDHPAPVSGAGSLERRASGMVEADTGMPGQPVNTAAGNYRQQAAGTVSGSLERLGAKLYCLDGSIPAYGYKEVELHEYPGKPTER